jgi:hypothetical protein
MVQIPTVEISNYPNIYSKNVSRYLFETEKIIENIEFLRRQFQSQFSQYIAPLHKFRLFLDHPLSYENSSLLSHIFLVGYSTMMDWNN